VDTRDATAQQLIREQVRSQLPDDPELILVTDLDGTLLGGPLAARRDLYAWLDRRRDRVLHVFCTGRGLASVARQLEEDAHLGLRAPHLVISDVGCTVACGTSLEPIPVAVDPIEARWQGVAERLAPLLAGRPGITDQPVETTRRLAYYYDPDHFDHSLVAAIEAEGADCLLSDNRFMDLLPAGVNKGSTLLDLLDLLRHPRERVVTAGDTLNDLSMFLTGLRGVVVGNAEAALLEQIPEQESLYRASAHGCAGILEGLHHFGFGDLLR
jgi:hydroxymethylpyrimidine pyrophosphatase-like HAD family hydrolase